MYRDPTLAAKEREIAQLREELRAAKADDQEMVERLEKAERDLVKEKARPKHVRKVSLNMPKFPKFQLIHLLVGGLGLALVVLVGICIYNYATNIQEGVVTGKMYHPPHTSCSTDSEGHVSCTNYPESWSVDISYEGRVATWGVSEAEYSTIDRGQWFCYTDIFHSADNCHGPEDN